MNQGWDRIVAEPISVTKGPSVKVVTTTASTQTTKTVSVSGWNAALQEIVSAAPKNIHVTTPQGEWHARRGKRRWLVSLGRPANVASRDPDDTALPEHDRSRQRLLDPRDPAVRALLTEVGLLGKSGQVRGEAAGKYRQVQHFLELLRPLAVLDVKKRKTLRIVDAGCGAAHLGLALYLFALRGGLEPALVGVDRNEMLIEKVSEMAKRLHYPRVQFMATDMATVGTDELGRVDILVSLHLCDTATDDALMTGVRAKASAIVLAPCCQHELIPQLSVDNLSGSESTLVRHGAMRERMASILTDEFRILALEASGYRVDTSDFTGPENTAKNLLIRAEKRGRGLSETKREAAKAAFHELAQRWGVNPACAAVL